MCSSYIIIIIIQLVIDNVSMVTYNINYIIHNNYVIYIVILNEIAYPW